MRENLNRWYDMLLSQLLRLLGFASCAGIISCDIKAEYGPPPEYDLIITPERLSFPAQGGSSEVNISTEGDWSISNISSYVYTTNTFGHGNSKVSIKVTDNDEEYSRNSMIIIKGSSKEATLTIIQEGKAK